MRQKTKAVILDSKDNVGVALMDLKSGIELDLRVSGQVIHMKLVEPIPYQHKFSITHIGSGSKIIKDSVVIGEATQDIKQGQHIHVHNMTSLRVKAIKK
ncbi:UxaA family hydrolase [Chloroflexota bacterium]